MNKKYQKYARNKNRKESDNSSISNNNDYKINSNRNTPNKLKRKTNCNNNAYNNKDYNDFLSSHKINNKKKNNYVNRLNDYNHKTHTKLYEYKPNNNININNNKKEEYDYSNLNKYNKKSQVGSFKTDKSNDIDNKIEENIINLVDDQIELEDKKSSNDNNKEEKEESDVMYLTHNNEFISKKRKLDEDPVKINNNNNNNNSNNVNELDKSKVNNQLLNKEYDLSILDDVVKQYGLRKVLDYLKDSQKKEVGGDINRIDFLRSNLINNKTNYNLMSYMLDYVDQSKNDLLNIVQERINNMNNLYNESKLNTIIYNIIDTYIKQSNIINEQQFMESSYKYIQVGSHYYRNEDGYVYKYIIKEYDEKENVIYFICNDKRCNSKALIKLDNIYRFIITIDHNLDYFQHNFLKTNDEPYINALLLFKDKLDISHIQILKNIFTGNPYKIYY